jgi:hypothetical protein
MLGHIFDILSLLGTFWEYGDEFRKQIGAGMHNIQVFEI